MADVQTRHVAVVDDNAEIRELLGCYLSEHGYRVSVWPDVRTFRALLEQDIPDLIVLDIMMPGEDGLSFCRDLYARQVAPVIFLTAMAADVDRIVGLEVGADDYVTKPFNPRELLARIKAVLRRSSNPDAVTAGAKSSTTRIMFEDKVLDLSRREILGPDQVATPLSSAEFKMLKMFLEHPGEVLSRDRLLQEIAGRASDAWDRSIDNQISRLRRKVEADPKSPTLIKTQWGDGYVFTGSVHR